jgi:BMFP domain-containing protein YqiC
MATQQSIAIGKAVALDDETIEAIQGLLEEESERLLNAKHDVMGRNDFEYVSTMLLAELTRVVAAQDERIKELESHSLTDASKEKTVAKK